MSDQYAVIPKDELLELLKKELPGFESKLELDDMRGLLTLRVKGPFTLFGAAEISGHRLAVPTANELQDVLVTWADDLVQRTREHAIFQLGLDTEIDRQIEVRTASAVQKARGLWEQTGWQKGYIDGVKDGAAIGAGIRKEIDEELSE